MEFSSNHWNCWYYTCKNHTDVCGHLIVISQTDERTGANVWVNMYKLQQSQSSHSFSFATRFLTRVIWRVPRNGTGTDHSSEARIHGSHRFLVAQAFCVQCLVDRCLSYCPICFGHCIALLTSDYTVSDYLFDIFSLIWYKIWGCVCVHFTGLAHITALH